MKSSRNGQNNLFEYDSLQRKDEKWETVKEQLRMRERVENVIIVEEGIWDEDEWRGGGGGEKKVD